ncbi:hypothetical protein EON66_07375 [archaeon]|nr:MAG: hypothetical protein EON66_07375 [archaeon]
MCVCGSARARTHSALHAVSLLASSPLAVQGVTRLSSAVPASALSPNVSGDFGATLHDGTGRVHIFGP